MTTFKAYLKKEWLETLRSHRLLALGAGLLSFAVLNPLLLKLTPLILESQAGPGDWSVLIDLSQREALRGYLDSLYEIGSLVAVLAFMGAFSGELNRGALVLPLTAGARPAGIYWAKLTVGGLCLFCFSLAGTLIAHSYGAFLFGSDLPGFSISLRAGAASGLYLVFAASLTLLASSLFRRPALAAFTVLAGLYTGPFLGKLAGIENRLPFVLLSEARALSPLPSWEWQSGVLCTFAWMGLLSFLTLKRLETMEKAR